MRAGRPLWIGLLLVALGIVVWQRFSGGEAADIRRRLEAFADSANVNRTRPSGPSVIAGYFSEDVVIDLGHGASPIDGRPRLEELLERLQSRLAPYTIAFADIRPVVANDRTTAQVALTAQIRQERIAASEPRLDAREFSLTMRRAGGVWLIARVTAVDTLK